MLSLQLFCFSCLTLLSISQPAVSVTTATSKEYGVTDVEVERVTYEWTIKHFSLLPQKKGEFIHSPIFHTRNHNAEWKLRLYPQGNEVEHYVALFLHLHSQKDPQMNITAHWELSIISSNTINFKQTFNYTYDRIIGYGMQAFISKSDLVNFSRPNDEFTIRAEIDILMRTVTGPSNDTESLEKELFPDLEKGRWNEHFGQLFKDPKFSDVVIVVANEKLSAHKIILATRSPVFAAMFEAKERTGNRSNEVKIEDMEPVVLKAMLEFIYTDEVTDLETLAAGLLEAADRFQLSRLKAMSEIVLYRTLKEDNAADLLVLTDLYHSYKLKEHVMKFTAKHLPAVMKTDGYKRMEETYTKLVGELFRAVVYRNPSI